VKDKADIIRRLEEIDWDFADFKGNNHTGDIHGLHWYPAPFPPVLAGTLIDILSSEGDAFLDPFSGSGVAPIEAWLRGLQAFGIDNNRFAVTLSQAKVQLVANATRQIGEKLGEEYKQFRRRSLVGWQSADEREICIRARFDSDAARWFIPAVLRELATIKSWINSDSPIVKDWRGVLLTVASSLLHGELSIVRNYHYTYVVDRSKVKEESRTEVDVASTFMDKLSAIFMDAELSRLQMGRLGVHSDGLPLPDFHHGRAQDLNGLISPKIALIVTSPPYFGMNDYVRSQYLSWLIFQWDGFGDDILKESGSRRTRTSKRALNTYFDDLESAFGAMYAHLRKGGFFALILGCSETTLAKESNPVRKLGGLVDAAGFEPLWKGKRRIRFRKINNTPYRTEHIWVYQK
jgi:DNA modification methylase